MRLKKALLAFALVAGSTAAQADMLTNTINFERFSSDDGTMYAVMDGSGDFTLDSLSDATISFEMWNWEVAPASFYFDVALNGYSLGRLYDNNPGNDIFNGGTNGNDVGGEYRQNYLSGTFDQAVLNDMLDTGSMVLTFTPSSQVQRYWVRQGQVEYTISSGAPEANAGDVSAPATAISGLALLGLGALRRRQRNG